MFKTRINISWECECGCGNEYDLPIQIKGGSKRSCKECKTVVDLLNKEEIDFSYGLKISKE